MEIINGEPVFEDPIDLAIKAIYFVYGKDAQDGFEYEDMFRDTVYGKVLRGKFDIEKIPVTKCTAPLITGNGYRKGYSIRMYFHLGNLTSNPEAYFNRKARQDDYKPLGFIIPGMENTIFYRFDSFRRPKYETQIYMPECKQAYMYMHISPVSRPVQEIKGDMTEQLDMASLFNRDETFKKMYQVKE